MYKIRTKPQHQYSTGVLTSKVIYVLYCLTCHSFVLFELLQSLVAFITSFSCNDSSHLHFVFASLVIFTFVFYIVYCVFILNLFHSFILSPTFPSCYIFCSVFVSMAAYAGFCSIKSKINRIRGCRFVSCCIFRMLSLPCLVPSV